jgi:hypothetical protein
MIHGQNQKQCRQWRLCNDDQYDGFELFTQMARANNKLVLPAKMGKKRKNTDA